MASILNIFLGIVRMKVVATLFGPVGVGLFGLMQNVMQTGSTIVSMGTGTIGTQQISASIAKGDPQTIAASRHALIRGSAILACFGGLVFWYLGKPVIASLLGGEAQYSDSVWLTLGVFFSILGGAQVAFLSGSGRIGDVARVYVLAGLAGTVVGLSAIWFIGRHGLGAAVVMVAVSTVLVASWYIHLIKRPEGPAVPIRSVIVQWRQMMEHGIPFMLSAVTQLLGFLAVRALVQNELGLEALGLFQSAWSVGAMYLVFLWGSMTTDYFARLSAMAGNHQAQVDLINEQTEVALLLSSPVMLVVIGTAPWIISILFSPEFVPAAEVLRWQILGDILRVLALPLSFLLLATGQSRTHVLIEILSMSVFVLATFLLLPILGLAACGVTYLLLFMVPLPLVWQRGRNRISFHWRSSVIYFALLMLIVTASLLAVSYVSPASATVMSIVAAVSFGFFAMIRLSGKSRASGHFGKGTALGQRLEHWISRLRKG